MTRKSSYSSLCYPLLEKNKKGRIDEEKDACCFGENQHAAKP